jgi:hypothetical protein
LTGFNYKFFQRNAADLERLRIAELKAEGRYTGPAQPLDHERNFFPKYDEFELAPGEDVAEKADRWKDYKNPYLKSEDQYTTKEKPTKK